MHAVSLFLAGVAALALPDTEKSGSVMATVTSGDASGWVDTAITGGQLITTPHQHCSN